MKGQVSFSTSSHFKGPCSGCMHHRHVVSPHSTSRHRTTPSSGRGGSKGEGFLGCEICSPKSDYFFSGLIRKTQQLAKSCSPNIQATCTKVTFHLTQSRCLQKRHTHMKPLAQPGFGSSKMVVIDLLAQVCPRDSHLFAFGGPN